MIKPTMNFIRYFKKIYDPFREFFSTIIDPPTKAEKNLIDDLRGKISRLPPLVQDKNTFDPWISHREKMRTLIMKKDPRFFLTWSEITYTMVHSAREDELRYLKNRDDWRAWEKYITESPIGHPDHYPLLPRSSGNLIHHAYSFALFTQKTKFNFKNSRAIFEFGGGYGSMARLAYKIGFRGTYIIFDLPEFLLLQEYYLKSLGLGINISFKPTMEENTVVLISSLDDLQKMFSFLSPDLVIGCWSLSESPLPLRDEILTLVKGEPFFLIAFQNKFEGADNLRYFNDLPRRYPDVNWLQFEIGHLANNYYLFGHHI